MALLMASAPRLKKDTRSPVFFGIVISKGLFIGALLFLAFLLWRFALVFWGSCGRLIFWMLRTEVRLRGDGTFALPTFLTWL